MKFEQVVTIYNRYKKDGKERYCRTILEGVFWDEVRGGIQRRTGMASADRVQLIIPKNSPAAAEYVIPEGYSGIGWTLKPGDIVVYGSHNMEVEETVKILDGFNKAIITTVDFKKFNSRLAHWEVVAR